MQPDVVARGQNAAYILADTAASHVRHAQQVRCHNVARTHRQHVLHVEFRGRQASLEERGVAHCVEGIGGGADLLSSVPPAVADVLYPPFLNGTWRCQRIVTSIEGDAAQAEGAWRLLGGTGDIRKAESFPLRFIVQPDMPVAAATPTAQQQQSQLSQHGGSGTETEDIEDLPTTQHHHHSQQMQQSDQHRHHHPAEEAEVPDVPRRVEARPHVLRALAARVEPVQPREVVVGQADLSHAK